MVRRISLMKDDRRTGCPPYGPTEGSIDGFNDPTIFNGLANIKHS